MVFKAFRLPPELVETLVKEMAARPDWSESDVAREALTRGLKSMARERKKKPKNKG